MPPLNSLILLAGGLLGVLAVDPTIQKESARRNGYDEAKLAQDVPFQPLGANWTTFYFTNAGSYGYPRFQVTRASALDTTFVEIVDLYCVGDSFTAYLQGPSGLFASLDSTEPTTVACSPYTADPDTAWMNPAWARTTLALPVLGTYNLTVVMRASPYSAGAMAARSITPSA